MASSSSATTIVQTLGELNQRQACHAEDPAWDALDSADHSALYCLDRSANSKPQALSQQRIDHQCQQDNADNHNIEKVRARYTADKGGNGQKKWLCVELR